MRLPSFSQVRYKVGQAEGLTTRTFLISMPAEVAEGTPYSPKGTRAARCSYGITSRAVKEKGLVGCVHVYKDAMLGRFYAICNCCDCCCGAMGAKGEPLEIQKLIAHAAQVTER